MQYSKGERHIIGQLESGADRCQIGMGEVAVHVDEGR